MHALAEVIVMILEPRTNDGNFDGPGQPRPNLSICITRYKLIARRHVSMIRSLRKIRQGKNLSKMILQRYFSQIVKFHK